MKSVEPFLIMLMLLLLISNECPLRRGRLWFWSKSKSKIMSKKIHQLEVA